MKAIQNFGKGMRIQSRSKTHFRPQNFYFKYPWHYSIKSYICLHTKRPYRLVAQDSGFSFPQQRFETAWGYKKKACFLASLFRYPRANRVNGYKKDRLKSRSFFQPIKGYKNPASPINGKSPSIGGRQYFTSWNERLLNKLLIHQNRSLRFLLSQFISLNS